MFNYVNLKIGKMRKSDECVVYPAKDLTNVIVQGKRLIMRVNLNTGEATANYKHKNPVFIHLNMSSAISITLDKEVLQNIKANMPKTTDGTVTLI